MRDELLSSPPVPSAPARDPQSGRFLPGNFAASQHALRSDRLPPEFEHLAAELAEFADASIADDGGADAITVRRRSLHAYRARVHRRIAQLDGAIEIRGLFDRRGKLRVAWLQQLQGLIRTAQGIDSLLGLERRARKVPTIEEWARDLAARKQAQAAQDATTSALPGDHE